MAWIVNQDSRPTCTISPAGGYFSTTWDDGATTWDAGATEWDYMFIPAYAILQAAKPTWSI